MLSAGQTERRRRKKLDVVMQCAWHIKGPHCKYPLVESLKWADSVCGGEGEKGEVLGDRLEHKNKWRWTENRSVVLNVWLHVGITWDCRKILMIGYLE